MNKLNLAFGTIALALSLVCTSPVQADTATGTPVTCKDGTAGTSGKGACSHHGGVNKTTSQATPAAAAPAAKTTTPAAKAPAPATAPASTSAPAAASGAAAVSCKDGTTGTAGKGACSHHGGVNKSGSAAPSTAPAATSAPAASAPAPAAPASKPAPAAAPASTGKLSNTDPTDAMAKCKDGTYSHNKQHWRSFSNR